MAASPWAAPSGAPSAPAMPGGGYPNPQQMQAQNHLAAMMWQYQMAAQAAQRGPPQMPYGVPTPPMPPAPLILNVRVEGLKFEYQLTEDDVRKVFSRYGEVFHVTVDREGMSATVQFTEPHHAVSAQHDLDRKQLAGMSGAYLLVDVATPPPYDPAAQMAAAQAAAHAAMQGFAGPPPIPGYAGAPAMPGYHVPPSGIPGHLSQDQAAAIGVVRPGGGCPGGGRPGGFQVGAGGDGGRPKKYTCKLEVGIENESEFRVGSRVIQVARTIWQEPGFQDHGGKTRLRGKGVGGPHEADEPLALCISCQDQAAFERAVQIAETQLQKVYADYRVFCQQKGREVPELTMKVSRKGGGFASSGEAQRHFSHGEDAADGRGGSGTQGRGERPPGAPTDEEVEKLIEERNEARKGANYKRSDEIREYLKQRGVVLMDEKGAKGNFKGKEVTQWRFWRP